VLLSAAGQVKNPRQVLVPIAHGGARLDAGFHIDVRVADTVLFELKARRFWTRTATGHPARWRMNSGTYTG
jgi:hypothetical protein